jgi:hypothetical protein
MEPSMFGRYPIKFAVIDTGGSSGQTTVISGVAGKLIVVTSFWCVAGGATAINWESASTPISGPASLADTGGVSAHGHYGLMETADGEDLNIASSAAVSVGGSLAYYIKKAAVGDGEDLI